MILQCIIVDTLCAVKAYRVRLSHCIAHCVLKILPLYHCK